MWAVSALAALQLDRPLCGLSVDLARAFKLIPRQHSFALAEHLGVPSMVLTPWKNFLQGCTRAFKVRDFLSPATLSTCGMPEGDALSVYSMVQLNFVWHIYQKQFCPSVRACSFVDNLSLLAECPADLAVGYSTLCAFFELWNLQIDLGKSYSCVGPWIQVIGLIFGASLCKWCCPWVGWLSLLLQTSLSCIAECSL